MRNIILGRLACNKDMNKKKLVLKYCSCSTTLHELIANQRVLSPTPYPYQEVELN